MEMAGYFLFALLAAFIGFLALIARAQSRRQQAMEAARAAYRGALAELQAHPGDEARRQRAIDTGRQFARVAREQQAPMIFDEAALARDLEAASGGGVAPGPAASGQRPLGHPPAEPARQRAVGGE